MVLVLALAAIVLPGLAVGCLGYGSLGGGAGGRAGCKGERCPGSGSTTEVRGRMGALTEVPSCNTKDAAHDDEEDLRVRVSYSSA
jgi:hypothetical protein